MFCHSRHSPLILLLLLLLLVIDDDHDLHDHDAPTLKAILSTSHRFHALGLEEALRSLVWDTPQKTRRGLRGLLNDPAKCRIPRTLAMTLDDAPDYLVKFLTTTPDEFRCLSMLCNLRVLTITGGTIISAHFQMFRHLRRLTELQLEFCSLAPFVAGDPADADFIWADTALTKLVLYNVVLSEEFHAEGAPTELLRRVESLEITSFAIGTLAMLFPHLPALVRLSIDPRPHSTNASSLSNPTYNFPASLRAFAGPLQVALEAVAQLPQLEELSVLDALASAPFIEALVEKLNPETTRVVALKLERWEDAVVAIGAVARCLRACEHLRLVYEYGGSETASASPPSLSGDLLGAMEGPLASLKALHTLVFRPVQVSTAPAYRRQYHAYSDYLAAYQAWSADLRTGRARAVPPDEARCRAYLAVWGAGNPRLRLVGLGAGEMWHREAGGRWVVREGEE
ncbi:hypothetical protein C8R46DRAFT_1047586 [Mycena filopes]|nr:hypothetical protein C8R46DRAFT_1047586 [Mycena filopes]